MKLDRNIPANQGDDKYAVINLRLARVIRDGDNREDKAALTEAIETLESLGLLEWGEVGSENEFFLIKLKDRSAAAGLRGYAIDARGYDPEWYREINTLADRAGPHSPFCKTPD